MRLIYLDNAENLCLKFFEMPVNKTYKRTLESDDMIITLYINQLKKIKEIKEKI